MNLSLKVDPVLLGNLRKKVFLCFLLVVSVGFALSAIDLASQTASLVSMHPTTLWVASILYLVFALFSIKKKNSSLALVNAAFAFMAIFIGIALLESAVKAQSATASVGPQIIKSLNLRMGVLHFIPPVLPFLFLSAFGLLPTLRAVAYSLSFYLLMMLALALAAWSEGANTLLTLLLHPYALSNLAFFGLLYSMTHLNRMHLQSLHSKIKMQSFALLDELSKLPNRRALELAVVQEQARFKRYGIHCAVFYIDIDHFKKYNELNGKENSNRAISRAAEILKTQIPSGDTLGRWGRDEFVAIVSNAELSSILLLAEKIRALIGESNASTVPPFTVSIGITFIQPSDTELSAINRAGLALIQAKAKGRNAVALHQDDSKNSYLSLQNARPAKDTR